MLTYNSLLVGLVFYPFSKFICQMVSTTCLPIICVIFIDIVLSKPLCLILGLLYNKVQVMLPKLVIVLYYV